MIELVFFVFDVLACLQNILYVMTISDIYKLLWTMMMIQIQSHITHVPQTFNHVTFKFWTNIVSYFTNSAKEQAYSADIVFGISNLPVWLWPFDRNLVSWWFY